MDRYSSFMAVKINGTYRLSFTFDKIDEKTGIPVSVNNKKHIFVVDQELESHLEAIGDYIQANIMSANDN